MFILMMRFNINTFFSKDFEKFLMFSFIHSKQGNMLKQLRIRNFSSFFTLALINDKVSFFIQKTKQFFQIIQSSVIIIDIGIDNNNIVIWIKGIWLDFVLKVSVVNVIKIKLVVNLHFRDPDHFVILVIHNCEIWCCGIWRWVDFFKIDAQSGWWLFDKFAVLIIAQWSDQGSWCWESCTYLSNVTPNATNSTSWVSTTTFIQLKLFTF